MAGQSGNKNKKYGRNKVSAGVYEAQGRKRKNKTRRLLTLLRKQPTNQQIVKALDNLNISETRINQVIASSKK